MTPPTRPPYERFREKYAVDPESGCWLWTAGLMPNGYAQFRYATGKNGYGHRFAYEELIGPIPEGRQLHHVCEVKRCVNPAHLRVTTPRENVMASDTTARQNARKTHCPRGHEFTPENTYVSKAGRRMCRACLYERNQRFRAENAEHVRAYQRGWKRKRAEQESARPSSRS